MNEHLERRDFTEGFLRNDLNFPARQRGLRQAKADNHRDEEPSSYHALSLGAGVNSTALLLLAVNEKIPLDEVVFADTGAEKPETYKYLKEQIEPFLASKKIPLSIVKAKDTIIERCMRGHTIPDRHFRWSTRDYKIRPIYKHLKLYAPVVCYLGISTDEAERVKPELAVDWLRRKWPLIDRGFGREDCEKYLKANGWPVPVKSGCWFCPFQKVADWKSLFHDHPELFEKAIQIEQNGSKYPEFVLWNQGKPLVDLKARFEKEKADGLAQFKLDSYQEECEGFCFT